MHASFTVSSFFDGTWKASVPAGGVCDFGAIRPHACGLYKIQPTDNAPAVITSDAHFSMGKELADLSIKDNSLHFSIDWKYETPAHYGIRIPTSLKPTAVSELPAGLVSAALQPAVLQDDVLLQIVVPGKGSWDYTIPLVPMD